MSEIANLTLNSKWTKDSRICGGAWVSVVRRVVLGTVAGGLGTAMAAGIAYGQQMGAPQTGSSQTGAPRYQSPFGAPAAPPQAPALPTPAAITANGSVVEDVVARVNDQIISRSDVERSQQQLQQELEQENLAPAEREQRQKDMLRDMVDQQLLISKGKELGINADAEVIRRLDEIRKQNHLETMEDLEKSARQQGVNFEDFKANLRNSVVTQQVVRDEVGRHLQPTQAQEQAYYDAHKQEFAQPEQVRLSEILVPLPADADAAAVAQAQKKIDDIAAKVTAGGKFDELAKQYSGGPTAAQGGDLGTPYKRGAMAQVFDDQTFKLPAGGVTTPIRTRQGFVILKVTEHQQAGVPTLKEVEPQVQEGMYLQQMQPALRVYLTRLREEAYIDIKPGFVDTGASAKQTKPVFSAYAAPVPKKKKVLQKARFDRGARSLGARTGASTGGAGAATAAKTPSGVPALPAQGMAATPTTAASTTAGGEATTGSASAADPEVAPAGAAGGSTATATTSAVAPAGATGKTRASTRTVASVPKRKKIKREKIRYGQAPRNSLPAGTLETATGADVGAGAASAAVTPGGVMAEGAAANTAPGAAIAPVGSTTEISSTSDADPLAPKTTSAGKTRFAAKDKEFRAEKAAAKQAKVREKVAAKPAGPDVQEAATQTTQATPLGLNGDTATKKKKVKVKGAPKERLQGKKPDATPETPVAPTVNPTLGTSPGGSAPATPSADTTTLPPVTAPAPGAPPQGQPLSPTGAPATTPNGTAVPQPPQ